MMDDGSRRRQINDGLEKLVPPQLSDLEEAHENCPTHQPSGQNMAVVAKDCWKTWKFKQSIWEEKKNHIRALKMKTRKTHDM